MHVLPSASACSLPLPSEFSQRLARSLRPSLPISGPFRFLSILSSHSLFFRGGLHIACVVASSVHSAVVASAIYGRWSLSRGAYTEAKPGIDRA